MKKYLAILFLASVFFTACKKEDDYVFDQSPSERIAAALQRDQALLISAENGWKAVITVDSGKAGMYSFYMKFNDQNRVTMVSDFDTLSTITPKESGYRIKAMQQPTLIFDTYTYINVLADPNEATDNLIANINGGEVGQGLLSDFEFIFDDDLLKGDTITLIGKKNGALLKMVKATKEEADIYSTGQWNTLSKYFTKIFLTYYSRLTLNGIPYDVHFNFDPKERTIIFNWLDGTVIKSHTTTFINTLNGIELTVPLVNGTTTINKLNFTSFDAGSKTLSVSSGSITGTAKEVVLPLKIDADAPQRWVRYAIDQDSLYWISWDGFHVNGKNDGYNISSIAQYYYLIYWPEYNPGIDFFGPIFLANNSLSLKYGAAITHTIGSNGIAVFKTVGNYGTYPATGPAAQTKTQLLIPEGYYFVQTSETTYDMVSAKDGKAWIAWEF